LIWLQRYCSTLRQTVHSRFRSFRGKPSRSINRRIVECLDLSSVLLPKKLDNASRWSARFGCQCHGIVIFASEH
jgi:hypothetical protein